MELHEYTREELYDLVWTNSLSEITDRYAISTASTWCRNVKQPKIQTLFVIARFLQLEATELLNSAKGVGG
jgi:hypothetical protein